MSARLDVEKDKGGWDWELYLNGRPTYRDDVFSTILDYHEKNGGGKDRVVDVGCGPGNSTVKLASDFKDVVGVDLFPDHLPVATEYAKKHGVPHARFLQGSAEDLSLFEPGSVDLLSAFMAIHWIDKHRFMDEVQRVLRPKGTLAVVAYSSKAYLQSPAEARPAYDSFMEFLFSMGWREIGDDPIKRKTLEHNFSVNDSLMKNIPIPAEHFDQETRVLWSAESANADGPHRTIFANQSFALDERGKDCINIVHQDDQACRRVYSFDLFKAYVGSFSVVKKYKSKPEFAAEYESKLAELERALGGPVSQLDLSWEMAVLLASRR
ncbi:unnamed protein product [Tilletia controversa]|uniref:Methyltransferase type 11 domain-containing protein n=3 Tax=Tilletia TaxID=13289 RepID=A0A8X7MVS4_9BASI|nr:hypothetical protein CF335_g4690 [Tilletia laevis]KAE8197491.1 hypothetical protein CF328_g3826 [Tilletia controversa]KAE8257298.1 hypothetical protein A4X03_0g4720 [Tilletia caries]KAE8198235.1 hypothetical protein CF336_g1786 [Tilletia laevis]KAE8250975.1 hypothetical protein A4X06_0g2864 [Tilletia controversa]